MTDMEYKRVLKDKLITYRNSLNLPKNITFGIEIEYENIVVDTLSYILYEEQKENINLNNWINKNEIDIAEERNNETINGEVGSTILRDTKITWESLEDILELLKRNDAVITEKCGGHVNVGAHILKNNKKYFRNFLLLWLLYEKEIYAFSSGNYIKVRNDEHDLFQRISKNIRISNITNTRKVNYILNLSYALFDKSHDIYICNDIKKKVYPDNRIEFRIPNGTLEKEIWQNYINFFTKFLIACTKELDVEKTIYKIEKNDHSASELADYIFNEDIDKENFLIQTLKTNKIYKKELPKHIIY